MSRKLGFLSGLPQSQKYSAEKNFVKFTNIEVFGSKNWQYEVRVLKQQINIGLNLS